ncbi:hypothetical protein ACGE0T_19545 [Parabacteroides sp. APC149_11_2_Y6]
MKKEKIRSLRGYPLCVLILCMCILPVYAVDNFRITDIRCLGMGGNGVTQSVLSNPSLVCFYDSKLVQIDYFNRYSVKELGTIHAGFIYPNTLLPAAVDIFSFGFDGYRESMFRLSMGKQLNRKWKIGISIQYALLQTELSEKVLQGLSTDVGILYSPVDKLLIGLLIMNLPSVTIHSEDTDIKILNDYSIQIGFQWSVINSLLIAGTVESNKTVYLTGSIGAEYIPFNRFSIRAGMNLSPLQPSLGIGYCFSRFSLDVAGTYHTVLGISTGVGIKYAF